MDFQGNWLRLEVGETKKNGEGRNFPLTHELRNVLEEQVRRPVEIERLQEVAFRECFSTPMALRSAISVMPGFRPATAREYKNSFPMIFDEPR